MSQRAALLSGFESESSASALASVGHASGSVNDASRASGCGNVPCHLHLDAAVVLARVEDARCRADRRASGHRSGSVERHLVDGRILQGHPDREELVLQDRLAIRVRHHQLDPGQSRVERDHIGRDTVVEALDCRGLDLRLDAGTGPLLDHPVDAEGSLASQCGIALHEPHLLTAPGEVGNVRCLWILWTLCRGRSCRQRRAQDTRKERETQSEPPELSHGPTSWILKSRPPHWRTAQ